MNESKRFEPSVPRRWPGSLATSLFLILSVALGLRLSFAFYEQRQIPQERLRTVPFQYEAGNIAASIAQGNGFSSPFHEETGPTAWLTPVYPVIVAGIFRAVGVDTYAAFEIAVFLNILFSTLTCVPIYFAGRRIAGTGVGAGAAWLWAIFPNAIIIPFEWIWDTSLSALLAATILFATIKVADSKKLRDWCAYGLLWGIALMTNPSLGSLLPFLLGWAAWRSFRENGKWLTNTAAAAGIALLCCVPWTIRNYEVFHRLVPLRSTFGLQLWLGNSPYYIHTWPAWLHPIDNPDERAKYMQMGESAYMQEKLHEALHYIAAHPSRFSALCWKRFVTTWLGTEHPIRDTMETRSHWVLLVNISNIVASLGVVGGMFVLFHRRNAYAIPVIAFPIVFPCVYYITVALLRYRHPIDPIVVLLGAIALSSLGSRQSHLQAAH